MSGKKKTTFAKLARERRLHERRIEKKARKDARRQARDAEPPGLPEGLDGLDRDEQDEGAEPSVFDTSTASADR